MKKKIQIEEMNQGARLDSVICSAMDSMSRSQATALINKGAVLVNCTQKKPGYKIRQGDQISVEISKQAPDDAVLPENIPIQILFEDGHVLVINKAPGMVVHPAPGNNCGTLVNALMFHCPEINNAISGINSTGAYNAGPYNIGQDQSRPGIVHRLDKDTSGLMVIAKTGHALKFLQKEFKYRRVEKRYLALVAGQLEEACGEINLPIGRHPVKRKLMAVNYENGKSAVTSWSVKKQYQDACFVEVLLKTGRTHQIRVHFYAIDHPLIGDPIYQPRRNRKKKSLAKRQMLHSWKLSFRHPYSGRRVSFECELPDDFEQIMKLF